jgi:hypothetical protein
VNRIEAAAIMSAELAKYELLEYAELARMIDAPKITSEVVGPSGTRYFLDIRAWWDGKPQGDIRVSCNVDDGGVSAFLPLSGDFLKQP